MSEIRLSKDKKRDIIRRLNSLRAHNNKIHIISDRGKWAVKSEGRSKAYRLFDSKKDAIDLAKDLASQKPAWEVVVHNKDGTVANRYSKSE